MKKTSSLVLVLALGLAAVSLATEDTWTQKTDMPTVRRNLWTAALNGKIYAVGGNPGSSGGLRTLEVYDPATDTWEAKASMSRARGGLSVSEAMGKIYAIGGMTGPSSSFTTVEEYDPTTDTWTTKAPMPTGRFGLSTSAVNGKVYAIGGQASWPNVNSRVEEYDPVTDTWTRKADMPTARAHLSTSVINGKIYAIGGGTVYPSVTARVEEYDPVTDTWIIKADMPTARTMLATCVSNGKIYAIGGVANGGDPPISSLEEYDPVTDTWTTKADMPVARSFLAASAVNGIIYAIGGTTGAFPWPLVATVEAYDPGFRPPDFNHDYRIDIKDLILLIEHWGTGEPSVDIASPDFLFGDGVVDAADLEVFMDYWGQEVDDPRLMALWRLDETDGDVAYDSAVVNDAVVMGDALWKPEGGQVGGALQLDGIDDYLTAPFILNPVKQAFSAYAWIKGGQPGQTIISQQGAFGAWLSAGSAGALSTGLTFPLPPVTSDVVITDDQWHHIGLVSDGSGTSLYVDDIEVTRSAASPILPANGDLQIGVGKNLEPGSFWSGLIDDVRIYDRVVEP